MNTIITELVDAETENFLGFDVNDTLLERAVASIASNNTFVPNIDRVVFNTKTEKLVARKDGDGNPVLDDKGRVVKETVPLENPVLVTVVYFKDGTKVTVKNSDKDAIILEDYTIKLSDGSTKTVKTASRESKEIGLVYAIAKRVICKYDDCGNIQNAGFAKFLNETIEKSHVQDVEDSKLIAERKISKARNKQNSTAEKPEKPKKENLRSVVNKLSEAVSNLGNLVKGLVPKSE